MKAAPPLHLTHEERLLLVLDTILELRAEKNALVIERDDLRAELSSTWKELQTFKDLSAAARGKCVTTRQWFLRPDGNWIGPAFSGSDIFVQEVLD